MRNRESSSSLVKDSNSVAPVKFGEGVKSVWEILCSRPGILSFSSQVLGDLPLIPSSHSSELDLTLSSNSESGFHWVSSLLPATVIRSGRGR